ncbi:IS1/IS1595 family N-terminal zinc-binding domain-containing protein, partial [Paenarthrobacter ureafaciens]
MCGQTLVRNGKTSAGKQRYRCLNCGSSRSTPMKVRSAPKGGRPPRTLDVSRETRV